MKRLFVNCLIVCVGMFFIAGSLFAQGNANYVGAKKCAMCHRGEKKGKVFEIWEATKHASAYKTLATPAAKEVAKKANVSGDPQKSAACLVCHVTGHGKPETAFVKGFMVEDGVQCEACHGAGSNYQKMSIMKDKKQFLANGGVLPTEKECKTCHNEKSPTYKAFDWAKYYKQIEHHVPKQ